MCNSVFLSVIDKINEEIFVISDAVREFLQASERMRKAASTDDCELLLYYHHYFRRLCALSSVSHVMNIS